MLVLRDVRLALRQGSDAAMVVVFFVLGAILFPFGIGPEAALLARIAPGIIWVMALFASLLSLERLFNEDFTDGSLDLVALSPLPLELVALAKALAHWLVTGVPLLIATPILGLFLNLPVNAYGLLLGTLALGTPALSLIGSVGAALTLGARRAGVLISLLILPLTVPVLIFGAGGIEAALTSTGGSGFLQVLAGLMIGAVALCPWATAAALRQAIR